MREKGGLKSISAVMGIMLLGKLLSLIANQAYISFYGAGNEELNIFSWALQIPNYIFQSIGTALSSVVIPIFAALVVQGKKDEADGFGRNIITVSTLLTAALVGVGMVLGIFLPNFTDFENKSFAVKTIEILMPVMFFYGLTYIYQGILQSLGHFTSAALVNLPSGIVIILYLILFGERGGVTGLTWAVVLGLFLQAAILIFPAKRAGFSYRFKLDLKSEHIRTAGKMMVPVILGASAYQFNMFFNNTMMTNVAPNSVSLFNFVQTLILSSVMTLVLAVTSVVYPKLTERAARGDMPGFREVLGKSSSGLIFFLMPITFGLAVLSKPLLTLISLHGRVEPSDIETEAGFLLMYCPGIVFLGLKEIADRSLYSLKNTRVSAVTGVIIMALNMAIGFVLSKYTPLKAYGIPLGYSVSVILGTLFLMYNLRKRVGHFGGKLAETSLKTLISSGVMAAAVFFTYKGLSNSFSMEGFAPKLLVTLLPALAGILVFFPVAFILRTPPLMEFLSKPSSGKENGGPKILYLINFAGAAGTEKYVELLINSMVKDGTPCGLCYNEGGELAVKIQELGVPVHRLKMRSPFDIRAAYRLKKLCRESGYNIVHAQYPRENYIALISKLLGNRARVVFTSHLTLSQPLPWRILNRCFTPFDYKIIALCEEGAESLKSNGADMDRVEIIYNGIDAEKMPGRDRGALSEFGIRDELTLITLARFSPEKGLAFLLESLKLLRERTDIPFRVIIAGEGEEFSKIENLRESLGLSDILFLPGYRRDAGKLLSASDIYLNSSEKEAMSFGILEAMACSLPVVATDVGGNRTLVELGGRAGFIVPYGDVEAMSGKIKELLERPELRENFGKAAMEKTKTVFSQEEMLRKTREIYFEV